MAVLGELLFFRGWNQPSLDRVLQMTRETQLPQAVDKLREHDFENGTDEQLADQLLPALVIEHLTLQLADAKAEVTETSMQVQDHWGDVVRLKALRIAKRIPYSGDRQLWNVYASEFSLSPPRGLVDAKSVVVGMECRESESDAAISYIDQTVAEIEGYIAKQEAPLRTFNASLKAELMPLLAQRRGQLGRADDIRRRLQGG